MNVHASTPTACDYILVGSGINSLVCAALLARKGRRVLVLERNDRPGGCIRTEEITLPGFVHDVLSCWHPLFVTSPAYAQLRSDLERHDLEYCNTDTPTAVVRADGGHFILRRSRPENIAAMNRLMAGEGERYSAAMAELEQTLDLTFTILGTELWTWSTANVFLKFVMRRGPRALSTYAGDNLQSARTWLDTTFQSELVRACLAPWTLHAGLGPDATGSALMARIIPFTLEATGAPVVKGGAFNLVRAFEKLIREHAGELIVNADVEKVQVENGCARGVITANGRQYTATRGVICSVTPGQLYTRLLEPEQVPAPILREARAFRHGRADMQIHLALREPARWHASELDRVALVHLADGPDSVSRAVNEAERGLLPAEGTICVGQPAAVDPSRAPAGKGMLWIQILELPSRIRGDAAGKIPVPADGSWTEAVREAYADQIIDRIARHMPGLKQNILARAVLSPVDLEALNINLVGGDPYGGACAPDQFLLWRPLRGVRNHETPIRNLYHIGASTHPGPGLGGGSGYLIGRRL